MVRRVRSRCSSSAIRDHSRSSTSTEFSTLSRRKQRASVRSESAMTRASRRSSFAPATVKRSRNRSICLGLSECTAKPRSSRVSTTAPCGTSIPAQTAAVSPCANAATQFAIEARPGPSCANARCPTISPSASITQTSCASVAQSMPANMRAFSCSISPPSFRSPNRPHRDVRHLLYRRSWRKLPTGRYRGPPRRGAASRPGARGTGGQQAAHVGAA